jgi:diguanylate cyclase (GGDEF)-like protein
MSRILMVEDNPMNRRLVRYVLEFRGHEVIEAGSVDEGRQRLARRLPDLVILDLNLPGGGGELLLREIRGEARLRALPVVAVTAYAMEGDRERLLREGFSGYISKPIDTTTFGPQIESFLDKATDKAPSPSSVAPPKTALLLDDDEEFRALLTPLLEEGGYRVVHAKTGAEGDALIEREEFDLAVVDYRLPDTNGIEWIRYLRKRGHQTKILSASSYWRDLDTLRPMAEKLGITLLQKPILPTVFRAVMGYESRPAAEVKAPSVRRDANAQLAALRAEFTRELPTRLDQLSHALSEARRQPDDKVLLGEAMRLCHNMGGTAGSYGYAELGTIALQIEATLLRMGKSARRGAAVEDWTGIEKALANAVRSALGQARDAPTEVPPDARMAEGRILVVDEDPGFLRYVGELLRQRFLELMPAATTAAALERARATPPDAALIDVRLRAPEESFQLARDLRALPGCEDLPIAFSSIDDALDHQVAAAQAGASLYLAKSLDTVTFTQAIEQLLRERQRQLPHVLIVDDDPDFSSLITALLRRDQINSTALTDPALLFSTLERIRPDLMLLDVVMPGMNGFDLCRIIRTNPRWQDLPVLFLTAKTEVDHRVAAFQAGGDDYLAKPVVPEELLARIRVRLERARLARERSDIDAVTGLLSRRALVDRLVPGLAGAKHQSRPWTLCLLDLDRLHDINENHGPLMGDQVLSMLGNLLRRRFRTQDLRGRWAGKEFLLCCPDQEPRITQGALSRVLAEFSALKFDGSQGTFTASFSAGVASTPTDGDSLELLLAVCERRLRSAKKGGRKQVVGQE